MVFPLDPGNIPGSTSASALQSGRAKGEPRPAASVDQAKQSSDTDGPELAQNHIQENHAGVTDQIEQQIQDTIRDFEKVKDRLNEKLSKMHVGLEFTMHRDINRVVVHVVQRETGKVVRQIPPEEMLKLAEHLQEASRGLLVNTRS